MTHYTANNAQLAEKNTFELAILDVQNVGKALLENLGGRGISPFDFDRVSFPAAGTTHWTIYDSLSGEEIAKKEIIGVVFHQSTNRSFWTEEFSGTGVQPDCISEDGIVGHGSPGGYCASCPNNRFGSRGRGKACKESRELYILQEKTRLPIVIGLPPSSIRVFHDLSVHLGISGIRLHEAVVKFSLAVDKNADGIKFSKLHNQFLYKLPTEECENLNKFRKSFLEAFAVNKSNDTPAEKTFEVRQPKEYREERDYSDQVPF